MLKGGGDGPGGAPAAVSEWEEESPAMRQEILGFTDANEFDRWMSSNWLKTSWTLCTRQN
jgi:hypothetical protein